MTEHWLDVSKQFTFEAAHTLSRAVDRAPSLRVHGHSYSAEVTLRGRLDETTGMVMDLGLLEAALRKVRDGLHQKLLNDVITIGPPTIENIARWIWMQAENDVPGLLKVKVFRETLGDACVYTGPVK